MKSLPLVCLALLAPACAASRARARGEEAFHRGDFRAARAYFLEAVAADPGSEEARRLAAGVERVGALAEARSLFFAGNPEAALEVLDPIADADPADAVVGAWRTKVRRSVADTLVWRARDAAASEDFPAAKACFVQALETFPDHADAADGLAALEKEVGRRLQRGDEYYLTGMRAYGEERLEESRSGFRKSLKYAPAHPRATLRDVEVARRLAARRVAAAEAYAAEGRYAAAYGEAVVATGLDPDSAKAAAARAAMKIEVEAQELARKAEAEQTRGNLAGARELLDRALAHSDRPAAREAFAERIRRVADAELERLYLAALELEADRRLEPALAKYEKLLENTSHYRDAIARVDSLRALVAHVEGLYAGALAALAAGDEAAARGALDEISGLYPEYRDVAERRARLALAGPADSAPASRPAASEPSNGR